MKPLYWTRIVASTSVPAPPKQFISHDTVDTIKSNPSELWQEIDETSLDNLDEFTELFSRQAIVPKKEKEEKVKPTKVKTIKVLDGKRSQNVGIFSRSLHVDFAEIEHAIYHCDTSVVSLEALTQLMLIKATDDELVMIKEASASVTDAPLDPPEEFLLKISNFSCSAERISCIVFQADFDEGCLAVSRKVETVKHLCEILLESEELKVLFSIILTLGNYMNGGNRTRGQADGFGLEILGKLKDVKSSDARVTLLHFIVKTYISRCRKNGTPLYEVQLPIPDPGDIVKALAVDFKEVKDQVNALQKKVIGNKLLCFIRTDSLVKNIFFFFIECKKTTEMVIAQSNADNLQPFKNQMATFLENAEKRIEKQLKKLEESQTVFMKTLKFYKFIPKSGTIDECTPGQFFEYWAAFTNDFRDIWKKEMIMLNNEM